MKLKERLSVYINRLKKKKLKLTGYTYCAENHRGWGNRIGFTSTEVKPGLYKSKANGHLDRIPEEGDLIEAKVESGKVGQFYVTNVRRAHDPPDLWFSDLLFYGYKEEPK